MKSGAGGPIGSCGQRDRRPPSRLSDAEFTKAAAPAIPPRMRSVLRRLIPGTKNFEIAERRAEARAEIAEIERLHDLLVALRRTALEHLRRGSDASRLALDSAYARAEFVATHSLSDEVRDAVVYAVHQCIRVTGVEAKAPDPLQSAVIDDIEVAVTKAKAVLVTRVRKLGALVKGRAQ